MLVTTFKYVYLKYKNNLFENKTFKLYDAVYNILKTLQYSRKSLIVLKNCRNPRQILDNSRNSRKF